MVDLPQPDSPTIPSVSPPRDRRTTRRRPRVTACATSPRAARPRMLDEVLDLEQRSSSTAGAESGFQQAHAWPRATGFEHRLSSRQRSWPAGSAGGTCSPAGARGTAAAGDRPPGLASGRSRGMPGAARGCTGGPAPANSSRIDGRLDDRPPYITLMRSATSATTPRSWVMSSSAHPGSRSARRSSSRICACTVTSSAVVGSSAISIRGLHAMRWRSSPVGACPPRTDGGTAARRAPGRGCRPRRAARRPRFGAPARDMPVCASASRATCAPTVSTGLRAVIGSWKIIASSAPRTVRSCRSLSRAVIDRRSR